MDRLIRIGYLVPMASSASASPTGDGRFIDLDTLNTASGVRGLITQRVSNGLITFSIVRVFERDGLEDWTSFFSEAQIDDFEEMLKMLKKRIAELRKDPKTAPLRAGVRR